MSQATHNVIGSAGDIRSRCESLLQLLTSVERIVHGDEDPTVDGEAAIADATWRWAAGAKDYIDRAADAVAEWRRCLIDGLYRRAMDADLYKEHVTKVFFDQAANVRQWMDDEEYNAWVVLYAYEFAYEIFDFEGKAGGQQNRDR
jgi:hypothetical protein